MAIKNAVRYNNSMQDNLYLLSDRNNLEFTKEEHRRANEIIRQYEPKLKRVPIHYLRKRCFQEPE